MAVYTYERIEETMLKTEVAAWLNTLTSPSDKRITSYVEAPTVNQEDYIRIKILLETITP